MGRLTWKIIFGLVLQLALAGYAHAQTTTYHLHKEASTTAGLFQLKTAGPDGTTLAVQSSNLKNLAIGEYLVKAFDTQTGVPNTSGVIPAGSTITFTIWMKKTASSGTIYPRAKLRLNSSSGTLIGTATGATQLTTTLTKYTLTATTSSNVSMTPSDRFYLWVGVNLTAVATVNTNAVLNVEGTLNGNYNSTVAVPTPVPAPTISNLSPTSGVIGTSVTVTGTNFGATQGTSTIGFNGTTATATSWSNTSIVATVPAGATTGPVVVTKSGLPSNGVAFTVTPKIDSLTPVSGPVGTSITITGSSFGATQGTSTVTFSGTTATATSWNNTSIIATVPAGATTGPVVVTRSGSASNGVAFTVTPKIDSLTPASGPVGISVTITGSSFGATQGTSTIAFNGINATATTWNNTSIVATVPVGVTTGPVVVTRGGSASNGVAFTVTPKIDSLTPVSGPVGTSVTISGSGFGATQGTSTIAFNGVSISPTSWNNASIVAPIPASSTTGPVVVTVNGQASNGVTFVVTPQIDSLSPTSGSVGDSVTISGSTFGATQGTSTVTFNGTAASPTSWSPTSIVALVPSGGTTGPVLVTVGGAPSNGVNFTVITTGTVSGKVTRDDGTTPIMAAAVRALQGTTTVATGTTNSAGDYTLTSLAQGTYTIEASAAGFGTKNQNSVTVNGGSATTVNLSLDAIIAGPISYIYDASGRLISAIGSTETINYSYDAVGNLLSITRQSSSQLSIINVVPNSGPVGAMVTINGSGFSGVASENSVQFDGVAAAIASATTNRIITTVPSGVPAGAIQIAVSTPGGTVTTAFTVEPASSQPKIQVTPGNISVAPGNQVQFTAAITGLADQSINWSVNGVDGGNSAVGTISATGLYSSLNQLSASIHNIRATSIANPSVFGQAQVATLDPSYAQAVISRSVSVLRPVVIAAATAASVSIRKNPSTVTAGPVAPLLSVRRGPQSLAFGSVSPNVSLTTGPHIQSVSPANGSRGTAFTFTITGVNLQGATGLKFITTGGVIDSNVTATGVIVNGDGTLLTATVTVGATAALGPRIVVVTTSVNNSLAVDVGSNIIEVIQ